ncbi:MAG: T9SS type A sorting domain-containing protein, partial [Saprospiraceae bacterium]|nr:T9SS type A sorting domain-containing protein [Saprospiraceae bacterium]
KIRQPIGMRALSSFWVAIGNNMFYLSTARDMARFGILMQNKGIWDGDTILRDSTYYNAMISPSQNINPSYGYLWWLNGQSSYIPPSPVVSIPGQFSPNAPSDVYTAAGSQGQYISISPSTGLMMIRQGSSNDNDKAAINLHDEIWGKLMNLSCPTSTVSTASNLHSIRLLPNPIDGNQLQIQGLEGQFNHSIEISFCDLLGKCHLRVDQLTKNTIDISALDRGIYFVTFRNEDGTVYTQKLIRN